MAESALSLADTNCLNASQLASSKRPKTKDGEERVWDQKENWERSESQVDTSLGKTSLPCLLFLTYWRKHNIATIIVNGI